MGERIAPAVIRSAPVHTAHPAIMTMSADTDAAQQSPPVRGPDKVWKAEHDPRELHCRNKRCVGRYV